MPIAIDPIDPGLVLSELERFKGGIATAIAAEEELEQSRRARHLKLSREITAREQSDAQDLETRLAEIRFEHHQATEHEKVAYENRKTRIQHAYHASRATLANSLQQQKDRRVGSEQNRILSERKIFQQRLEEASAKHQSFQGLLAEDSTSRDQVRDSLFKALRSFKLPLTGWFDSRRIAFTNTENLDSDQLRVSAAKDVEHAMETAAAASLLPAAKFFRFAPLSLLAAGVVIVCLCFSPGLSPLMISSLSALGIGWLAILFQSLPIVRRTAHALALARAKSLAAEKLSAAEVTKIAAALGDYEKDQNASLHHTFNETDAELRSSVEQGQRDLQIQLSRLPDRIQDLHRRRLAKIDRTHQTAIDLARAEAEKKLKARSLARTTSNHATDSIIESSITKLAETWQAEVIDPRQDLATLDVLSLERFPAWTPETTGTWTPSADAPQSIRIGHLEIHPSHLPKSGQLMLPSPIRFRAPLALGFPDHGSLLIETDGDSAKANMALNAISIRILASLPPGRASFTFIDPIGLGKDFAGLMHLADYEETLIHHRIWTQTTQIEERLAELTEHIEKVIQMYLRNEFATIAEYNAQADTIPEKYHFLVIAGFPAAFSESAARRLRSIASSGARCGVHLLIQQDIRQPSPDPALDEELHQACLRVKLHDGVFHLGEEVVVFDSPPADEDATVLTHRIGKASIDSNRVEVPFAQIAPAPESFWALDTSDELRIPIGRSGAKKLQMLALGKGTRQHALIAGKTGSGKSTLFHVIITNLALWCSPEQVEFYLVDFKKGVEFKCYADKHLPHARVIAIESDRQFALSVLQRLDAELKRRGELFRKAGSQDLSAYHRSGEKSLPRTLLLIDEFQEFFTEDDSTAQQASLLLDRIVRQGRAFGIHAILGSQTLGGAYTLARATLGQMAVRIALQCNESDAHLIMDEENPAPRLLTRPGEGIYNDQSGALTANSPFQIVWLPEETRNALLDQIARRARDEGITSAPIVFEGNAPANIGDNIELLRALQSPPAVRPAAAQAWLGAPNSIKGPTAATFKRQSGSNLLVVSQAEEHSASLLAGAMISLAAQYPPDQAEFVILDPLAADDSSDGALKQLASRLSHRAKIAGPAEIPGLFTALAETLETRTPTSGKNSPEIFIIIHHLQRFKALRPDDEFRFSYDEAASGPSPSQIFANLLGEGGPNGIHILASIDGWNNISRWIPRKLLAEFEMRVLFQMSATDSSNLIDTPDASSLGLHRAVLHNEHLGTLETFRPYAPFEPDALGIASSPAH